MTVDLKPRSFNGATKGPHLLITGGVHGDEFEPIEAVRRLVRLFSGDNAGGLAGQVVFVSCVNEEAFLRGHRCASDNKDLARTCPGSPDGTITEQTAWALSELIQSVDFYIDLHTGGTELDIYPLAGYVLHSNADVLDIQRKMAKAFNLPVVWGTSANLEGRSLSVARDANVPAIYCEYGGAASCVEAGVEAYVEGCLNVMKALNMLDGAVDTSGVVHVVEDPREDSGHLQVCNPSPVDGFFTPTVNLGQTVAKGEPLGSVTSLKDDVRHEIHSDMAGVVLLIRTFPRVLAGESVGVILDTSL